MSNILDIYSHNEKCYAVTFELCTTCNWKCIHCYLPEHNDIGLPLHDIKNLLDKLRNFGVYELTLTGGEIFTRKDCMTIIEYARRCGFAVSILSNASLLNEEIIDNLAKMHIDYFDCTIFSMDQEVHDNFTQTNGSLKSALKNVLALKQRGIRIKVKCVLTKYNWSSYNAVQQFCECNNIDFLSTMFLYQRNDGDNTPLKMLVPHEHLEEIIRDTTVEDGYCYKGITGEDYICKSTRYSMFISASGDVQPCGNYMKVVGNVTNQSLEDIWNNRDYRHIRNVKLKDTLKCGKCIHKERCFVCAGVNEHEGYSALGFRPFDCHLAELRDKLFGTA